MLDKNQDINAINNSKAAGRDLIDNSTNYFVESIKHESAIAKILMGFLDIVTDVKYEKPDTVEYTIEDKIDHNHLTKYKDFFDEYMENYNLVQHKISTIQEEEPSFENRLISHIKNKYIKYYNNQMHSDNILSKIIDDVEQELKNHSTLPLEDIISVHYVVFYVFARCKIFEKPKKSQK